MRPRAQVIPMDSPARADPDDRRHLARVQRVRRRGRLLDRGRPRSITESQASFGRVVLDAKKLTAFASVPNELLADATAFGAFFDTIFPRALAWYEDVAFMTGTGVGEPLGFINCPASVQVTKESGQATRHHRLGEHHQDVRPDAADRAGERGVDRLDRHLPAARHDGPVRRHGRLCGVAGQLPELRARRRRRSRSSAAPCTSPRRRRRSATTGDINFVDLSYYLIGDRQIMQAMSSEHYQFQNDKTAFRVIERLDGRPWLQSRDHPAEQQLFDPFPVRSAPGPR